MGLVDFSPTMPTRATPAATRTPAFHVGSSKNNTNVSSENGHGGGICAHGPGRREAPSPRVTGGSRRTAANG